jgi:hypothetical protein
MYKKIRQGEVHTITGKYLYSGADTAVYFNSVHPDNHANVPHNGYSTDGTSIKIIIPCCLPEINDIIVYNGVNYYTGADPYLFVGAPRIDSFSPEGQTWNQTVLVKGKDFDNITSFFVGDSEVTDYDWPSNKKVSFRVPRDLESGKIKIYTDLGFGESSGYLRCLAPDMQGDLTYKSYSTKYYGDDVKIIGESLNTVNRIVLSGVAGNIFLQNFTGYGSTGIHFNLPEGVVNNSPITVQNESGYFQNGVFVENIIEQASLPTNLKVGSRYVYDLDRVTEVYGRPIKIRGVNLSESNILFKNYNNSYINSPIIDSGHNYVVTNTPKNIRYSRVMASGESEGLPRTAESEQYFYPLPTISGYSTSSWTMGEPVEIYAINAAEVVPMVGMSGYNLIKTGVERNFVAASESLNGGQDYFGTVLIDNSQLVQNPENGYTKISATVNSTMAGTGVPFLVSNYEANSTIQASLMDSALTNSTTYSNMNFAKGPQVVVAGKKPEILGIDNPRTLAGNQILISGNYFLGTTGLKLFNPSEESIISNDKYITTQAGNTVLITQTGVNENDYTQVHAVGIKLEDFNFQSKQGQFKFLAPYHE